MGCRFLWPVVFPDFMVTTGGTLAFDYEQGIDFKTAIAIEIGDVRTLGSPVLIEEQLLPGRLIQVNEHRATDDDPFYEPNDRFITWLVTLTSAPTTGIGITLALPEVDDEANAIETGWLIARTIELG